LELSWKCQYVLDKTIVIRCPRLSVNTPPLSLSVAVTSVPVGVAAVVVPVDGWAEGEAAGPLPVPAQPVSATESSSAAKPAERLRHIGLVLSQD
jgi:hypothetical protein